MITFSFNGQDIKLSKYIERNYPQISYAVFRALLRKKDIKINGVRIKADTVLKDGDLVKVYFDESKHSISLRTVFEDENLLVIDKPQGLLSVAEGSQLSAYSILLKSHSELIPFHRLDKNTSGLLLFTKNQVAFDCLKRASRLEQIIKVYSASVYGCVKRDGAVLTGYLKKDAKEGMVQIFKEPVKGAQKIVTEYKVVKRGDISVLDVIISSGKTHQIRAHLASMGHFILGDTKYGDRLLSELCGVKTNRQQLVAKELRFLTIDSPLSYLSHSEIRL